MPEQPVWSGSPSQLQNTIPFFLALLAILAIFFLTMIVWVWPPGICFTAVPVIDMVCRRLTVSARRFELTSERLLITRGYLSRVTDSLELYRVKDMRIAQPFLMRLFGLENIILTTSDQNDPLVIIDHIPVRIHLSGQIRAQVEACRMAKGTRAVELE